MPGGKDSDLRTTFNQDAEWYQRVRPGYPDALFADMAALELVGAGVHVLEIGCGTGQATLPLARLGCEIVALDIGADLAAVASRRLGAFSKVRVLVSSFEDWPLPAEPFDTLVSATAFHWIDPRIRVQKSADALRPGGSLVIISTHHVAGGTEDFWVEVQSCYERWDPTTEPGLRLPTSAAVLQGTEEIERSQRFASPIVRRYLWDVSYTTTEYLDLLLSYSGHRALEASQRNGLLKCIQDLIDRNHGGRVTKRYMTQLLVARRL